MYKNANIFFLISKRRRPKKRLKFKHPKYSKFEKKMRGFYFCEASHNMRSFVKIKFSRIGEFTMSFTDIGKSHSCHEFLVSKICRKIIFSRKFLNLQ